MNITFDKKRGLIDLTLEQGEDHISLTLDELREFVIRAEEAFGVRITIREYYAGLSSKAEFDAKTLLLPKKNLIDKEESYSDIGFDDPK